jgi:hypothetical protein
MAREDWKSIMVRNELVDLAEKAAEKLHYPNATQYINEILRDRLKTDLEGAE